MCSNPCFNPPSSQDDAELVTRELLSCLESPSAEVGREATTALGSLVTSGADNSVLDALASRVHDEDSLVRYAAALAMRKMN